MGKKSIEQKMQSNYGKSKLQLLIWNPYNIIIKGKTILMPILYCRIEHAMIWTF